ncbi:hypothetical protein [Methylomagnum sp.]
MNAIAEKIHIIESLSPDPKATVRLLDKVIGCLADDYRRKLAELEGVLAGFERQHGMTTAEFLRGFESGELGDAPEWFDWDGYAALAEEARRKLAEVGHGRT